MSTPDEEDSGPGYHRDPRLNRLERAMERERQASKLEKDEISDFGRKTTVSPASRVQFTLGKLIAGVAAVVVFTASVFGAYSAVTHALEAHIHDRDVHLDPDYYRGHGQVIGQFDLAIAKAEIKGTIDATANSIRQDLDALRQELATRDTRKKGPP